MHWPSLRGYFWGDPSVSSHICPTSHVSSLLCFSLIPLLLLCSVSDKIPMGGYWSPTLSLPSILPRLPGLQPALLFRWLWLTFNTPASLPFPTVAWTSPIWSTANTSEIPETTSFIFPLPWLFPHLSYVTYWHPHPSCFLPQTQHLCFLSLPSVLCSLHQLVKVSHCGTSLVVQWFRLCRLCASNAGGKGSIPDLGTKIPHAVCPQ